jgi:hypothetical protein
MKRTHYPGLYGMRGLECPKVPTATLQPASTGRRHSVCNIVPADRWVSTPDGAQTNCGRGRVIGAIRLAAGAVAIRTFLAIGRAIESGRGLTDIGEIEPWRG